MATAYAGETAPFTFIWTIENVSDMTYIDLRSPTFIAHTISDEEWLLRIIEAFDIFCWFETPNESYIDDMGLERMIYHSIDAEFSILTADGSEIVSPSNNEISHFMLSREELLERWAECVPNNTLTVQCRMWKNVYKSENETDEEFETTDFCYARTRLETYSKSFLWPIEEFSGLKITTKQNLLELQMHDIKTYQLKPITPAGPFLTFILFMMRNSESGSEDVFVDVLINGYKRHSLSYKILLLDANGQVKDLQVDRAVKYNSRINFESPLISKNKLITNKNLLLPNDTLLLKCSVEVERSYNFGEVEYCTSEVSIVKDDASYEEILNPISFNEPEELQHLFIKGTDENSVDDNLAEAKKYDGSCRDSCALRTSLKYLYNEATQTDSSLRIGKKLYPVHKNILSSRSPVFKRIFGKDMTENIVDISGVDENTLCHLLQFIYTDTVGELQFENTFDLYKAAADYQLLDLKDKCSDILKTNLSETSACDILFLAQQYQDDTLENAARDFARDKTRDIE